MAGVEPLIVTAAVILDGAGRVLLARRGPSGARAGEWEFPGGKVEAGESPEEALCRELREELDVAAEVGPLFTTVDHDYPDRRIRLLAYRCRLLAGEPRPIACAEVRWVNRAELAGHPVSLADRPIADRLANGEEGL